MRRCGGVCDDGGHADNLLGRVWCVTVGGGGAYWGGCGV